MHHEGGSLIYEGEVVCTISNPFKDDTMTVTAPFTGLMVGVLENPVVYPGNPLCHLVELGGQTRQAVEAQQGRSTADGGS